MSHSCVSALNVLPGWSEEKGGFCFETIGKSKCISEENECICMACPVASRLGFEYTYYCTRDSAKEQENNLKLQ